MKPNNLAMQVPLMYANRNESTMKYSFKILTSTKTGDVVNQNMMY